jgi:hypothetical protein
MITLFLTVGFLFIFARYAIFFTAFFPASFDSYMYSLYEFSQLTNEEWLAGRYLMRVIIIPFLIGSSLLTLFEVPIKYKKRIPIGKGVKI